MTSGQAETIGGCFSSYWRPVWCGEQRIGFGSRSDDARPPMWYNKHNHIAMHPSGQGEIPDRR